MKKLNFKRVLTAVLALAMLATMFALPTSAALPETTVQEWDFSGFQNGNYVGIDTQHAGSVENWFPEIGEYSTALADLKSADQKVVLGTQNAYWNLNKYWNINDGTVTFNGINYSGDRHAFVISLKLDEELQAGVEYTLNTDLAFTLEKWVANMSVYYSNSLSTASSEAATRGKAPDGSTVLYKIYKGEEVANGFGADSIPKTVVFTPENDLPAGGYISFRVDAQQYGATSAIPMTATATFFKLTAQTPYAADDNTAVYDEWDFTKIPNQNTSGQTVPQPSSDGRIILGNVNTYWNRNTTWDVANGNVEFNSVSATAESKDNFSIGFKLDMDLKAGVTYNFVTDIKYTHISNEWAGKFDFYYTPNKDNNYLGENFLTNMPAGSVSLGGYTKTGGFNSIPSTFTFTPETDLAAGGYLNIRYALWHSVNKLTISEAKITSAPTSVLRHYDLTTADDRACLIGTRATTVEEKVIDDATTITNWRQGGLGFTDFDFEAGKTYKMTFNYACYDNREINLWQATPDNFTDAGATWKKNGIASFPSTGGANYSQLAEYSFDFTAPTNIDYENGYIPVFYNTYWDGGSMLVKSITISEYSTKVIAMKADAPTVPTKENRLYTKIVLPEINTALQQYAMVDTEGNYTAINGNTVTGLNYDTEYQFVVKYIDSYKYLAGDYSDAITVKTRKLGDVTGDDKVDIIDLVRIKKGLAEDPDNAVYDIEPDGGEAGSLVYMRRIILGLVK